MKSAMTRMICRVLALALALLPIHAAQAGVIGTERIAVQSGAPAERNAVLGALGRADVANQLQSLGVDPQSARDRVSAMTDAEVIVLAGKLDAQPAGASGTILPFFIVVVFLVWYFSTRQ